jgi:hypothetical protein
MVGQRSIGQSLPESVCGAASCQTGIVTIPHMGAYPRFDRLDLFNTVLKHSTWRVLFWSEQPLSLLHCTKMALDIPAVHLAFAPPASLLHLFRCLSRGLTKARSSGIPRRLCPPLAQQQLILTEEGPRRQTSTRACPVHLRLRSSLCHLLGPAA